MKQIFICSQYRGDVEENKKNAKRFARIAVLCGYCPIVPHLFYPQFLDDNDEEERLLGITTGVKQMALCNEIWVFGTHISDGMAFELEEAKRMKLPVRLYDLEGKLINPSTLKIDTRVNDAYRKAVYGLCFARV